MKSLPSQLLAVLPVLGLFSGITNSTNTSKPVPKFALPEPPGPFRVKHDTFEIVDKSRIDPFNATHFRKLMVSRFDPVEDCEICHVPYMPPASAKLEHEVLLTVGWLPRVLEAAMLPVCCNNHNGDKIQNGHDSKFPLLVLSGGYNTTRLLYSALAQTITSAGYTVLTVDHTYETDIVEFPDGSIITGGRVVHPGKDPIGAPWALDVRAADISFLIDRFSRHRPAGVFGHSFGGAAAATTIAKDIRVAAGINLDGMQFGRLVKNGFGSDLVRQAFVLFGSEGHNTSSSDMDPSWVDFWKKMHEPPHDKVWTRELTVHPSMHGSYWDLMLVLDASGVADQMDKDVIERLAGPMAGERVMEVLHAYVGGFFGFVLKGEDDGLFDGPSEKFPDVEIIPYAG